MNLFDPEALGALGVLLTLVIGLPSVWFAARGPIKSKRQRDFAVGLTSYQVHTSAAIYHEDFTVLFRGTLVTEVSQVTLALMNTGGETIEAEDFVAPIKVYFPDCEAIWMDGVHLSRPRDLAITFIVDQDEKSIELTPLMLNAGDYLAIRFIVAGRLTTRKSGRIRGIPEISPLMAGTFDNFSATVVPLAMVAVAVLMMAGPFLTPPSHLPTGLQLRDLTVWDKLMGVPIGFVLIAAAVAWWRFFRRLKRARFMGPGTEDLFVQPKRGHD